MIVSLYTDTGIWSTWEGECDVTCGYGIKVRTRVCKEDPYYPPPYDCPVYCPGPSRDEKPCGKDCCERKWVFIALWLS